MPPAPGSRISHDLTGDMFIDAFNTVRNHPNNQFSQLPSGAAEYGGSGLDTIVSSPEETTATQDYTPGPGTGTSAEPKLNPRSCVTCRRRKVRCDKHEPCSNCVKASADCVFPPPGRAPRRPRRPQDAELLKRLRRLESVVDTLGAHVDEDGHVQAEERRSTSEGVNLGDLSPQGPTRRTSLEHGLGRLLIKEGRSRYISNEFWSSLGEEIAEIRSGLDSPSSEEDADIPTSETATDLTGRYTHHQGFIFGYSSLMYDMAKLHPNPSQIFILWEIFKENVDPLMKILHVPTVKNIIMKAAVNASSLSKASEALFYSICYASVVSMADDQCKQLMGDEKDRLMQKYRFAVEQGLARAQFLNSSNLMVLQAFVMFLTVVKFIDTSRGVWALSGLAMQQAQAQGLHRDGSNFNLHPFDTEMRRRLWWHISLQDARASEDHGADPTFHDHFFDTKMPLNVNDDDIWPEMIDPPKEQQGASDMTFCLVRFELGHIQRKLRIMASVETDDDRKRTVKEKEHLIDMTHQHMQERYFVHCDPNSPFLWVASTVGKLILAKMWLFVHHPRLYQDDRQCAENLKDQVFMTSVEVVEFGVLLERGENTSKWGWLFRTYMQWHAVAYVLSELCHRPPGPEFDRAWSAVDSVYDRSILETNKAQRGALWKPLKQLYSRAKMRRSQLATNTSPHDSSDSSRSLSTDSPGMGIPANGVMSENWLISSPYGNAVSTTGDAFGLDFNDPVFNEANMSNSFDVNAVTNGHTQPQSTMQTPIDNLPLGWTPGMSDFLNDFGGQIQPTVWQPRMQQEWH